MITLNSVVKIAEKILAFWQFYSFIYVLSMKLEVLKILRDFLINFIMDHNNHAHEPDWPDSMDRRVQDYAKRRTLAGFPTARFSTRQVRDKVRSLPNYRDLLEEARGEIRIRSQSARGDHADLVFTHIIDCLEANAEEIPLREESILEIQIHEPMVLELPHQSFGVPIDLFYLNQRFMQQFIAESLEAIAILKYLDNECTPTPYRQTRYSTVWWVSQNFNQTLNDLKVLLQLAGY